MSELESDLKSSLQTLPKQLDPTAGYDVERLRQAFPILAPRIYGKPLIYLDSAATSQKPQAVIEAMSRFFLQENANVHRGVHYLSVRATEAYDQARAKVQRFLNAEHAEEIVFVRGTTEAVNLVAQTYGKVHVRAGDEVLISAMEHHSNIVPWQMLCEQTGARLRVAPIDDAGELLLDELERLIGPRTRLVAVAHVSNVLGTINPIRRIVELAHARGARVLVDGAQAAPHLKLDVRALGCDFYALSGHKMYGPTGIGVLYGRHELLEEMPPYQGGGDMILSVSFEKTVYNKPPYRFEAGTPNMAGAIGLGAAIDFLGELGPQAIAAHEQAVLAYAQQALAAVPGLRLIGTAADKVGVLSFVLDGIHPHDIGTILDREGVAIRTGHHCAQPLMQRFGLAATARASLGCYSTEQDIDALVAGLAKVRELFR
ncbi:MAG: cysteine desulfurase [Pseudomonas sp.]